MKNEKLVVHKGWHIPTNKDIYIGRPTVLGNPFSWKIGTLAKYKATSAEHSVKLYAHWLKNEIVFNNKKIIEALSEIQDDSILVCWCKSPSKPNAVCHGDVIWQARQYCIKHKYF